MQLSQEGDGQTSGAAYSAAQMGVNGYLRVVEERGVMHAAMSHSPSNVLDRGLLGALNDVVDALERGRANALVLSSAQSGQTSGARNRCRWRR
jgi:hypothetical protein